MRRLAGILSGLLPRIGSWAAGGGSRLSPSEAGTFELQSESRVESMSQSGS